MNCIPTDPLILLSYINTMLRDRRISLDELCEELCIKRKILVTLTNVLGFKVEKEKLSEQELEEKLLSVGFTYNSETNSFI